MAHIAQMGNRIELVSMDKYFHDVTLGLYEQVAEDGGSEYLVHSYAQMAGVAERVQFVMRVMQILGGMKETSGGRLRFTCGDAHRAACKRLFTEASKVVPETAIEARPLSVRDKKSNCDMSVTSLGNGVYLIAAEGDVERVGRRVKAIAGGLRKLAEMVEADNEEQAAFSCGVAHDALVGMLLVRAPNVRAVIREQDVAAKQGVLAAPGAQSM